MVITRGYQLLDNSSILLSRSSITGKRPMGHLKDNNVTYFQHLRFAWSVAFILIVHGIFPFLWKDRGSELLCSEEED